MPEVLDPKPYRKLWQCRLSSQNTEREREREREGKIYKVIESNSVEVLEGHCQRRSLEMKSLSQELSCHVPGSKALNTRPW